MILQNSLRRLAASNTISRQSRRCLYTNSEQAQASIVRRIDRGRSHRIIFSGIQPTGVPHLGNYLGALRPWVELQNDSRDTKDCLFCVVDLHALTVRQDPRVLSRWRQESFASLLAVGLDPRKSCIFFQSDVSAHAELMWLLSTVASTGYLSRMTQWKSKLDLSEGASMDDEKSREKLKLGLFSYPVLQAADILLYGTTHVPIGADQTQHLEFTRSLANSFNSIYGDGETFELPEAIVSPAKRIMSLRNPAQKMSKSDPDENSRILITDTPEEIHTKIRTAVTDSEEGISYDVELRPGVSNLVDIFKYTSGFNLASIEIAKASRNLSKKAFKQLVAESVVSCLSGIREKYHSILVDPDRVRHAASSGAGPPRYAAQRTLTRFVRLWGSTDLIGVRAQVS